MGAVDVASMYGPFSSILRDINLLFLSQTSSRRMKSGLGWWRCSLNTVNVVASWYRYDNVLVFIGRVANLH